MPRYLLDPPFGHAFGFPKLFDGDIDALDIQQWLRDNGYPEELLAEFANGNHCRLLTLPDPE